jgi:hypothetical protein
LATAFYTCLFQPEVKKQAGVAKLEKLPSCPTLSRDRVKVTVFEAGKGVLTKQQQQRRLEVGASFISQGLFVKTPAVVNDKTMGPWDKCSF